MIVEDQAKIVRRIYSLLIEGKTPCTIAKILTEEGIKTPGGKDKWGSTVIESILTNEKYKGSALLQKTFTVDFLEKKMKTNEGEVPQYFIEHSHDAIIPPEDWELVQVEIARRKSLGRKYSGNSVFGARLAVSSVPIVSTPSDEIVVDELLLPVTDHITDLSFSVPVTVAAKLQVFPVYNVIVAGDTVTLSMVRGVVVIVTA